MPKVDDDYHVALEHIDRVMQRARDALASQDGIPAAPSPSVAPPQTPPTPPSPPPVIRDAPEIVHDALVDPRHGSLRFATVGGGYHNVPDHPALPEIARAAHDLVREYGIWAGGLPARAQAIAQLPIVDEQTKQALTFEAELELVQGEAEKNLKAAADKLRTAAAGIEAGLKAPGPDDLPPDDAKRLAEHVQKMLPDERRAFIGRLERQGDHVALRAIGSDRMSRYFAPDLDAEALVLQAGRMRTPRNAAVMDAYRQYADRVGDNLKRLKDDVKKAREGAVMGIPTDKLSFGRSLTRMNRH